MIVLFLLPIFIGGMLVHLLWPDREIKALFLKGFLGIGIGLGIWSLLYFAYLLFFAGQHWFAAVQVTLFLLLLAITLWQERKRGWDFLPHREQFRLTRTQGILMGVSCVIFLVSLTSTASYLLRRRQGDWDAWMMFNRTARFVYRDQADWRAAFSPQIDPLFHADYPLLLAMNIASGWDTLGNETSQVPMVQSALFAVACVGLMVTGLGAAKSVGQACLGLIFLWGTPLFVNEGAREMADMPLAFFILATGILTYLFVLHKKPGLIILAGLTAGLAAWTKNEGSVFIIAAAIGLTVACLREKPWRILFIYAVGLSLPLATVLYFKLFLAPPSDVLSSGPTRSIQQALDITRHAEILRYFWQQLLDFGSWGIPGLSVGILLVLLVYYLALRSPVGIDRRPAYWAGITMLVIQALGYYVAYLITPYDLTWHLDFSITRIFLQVFPLSTFLILCACRTPESVFDS